MADMIDAPAVIQREIDNLRMQLTRKKDSERMLKYRDTLKTKLDSMDGKGSLKDTEAMKKLEKWLFA